MKIKIALTCFVCLLNLQVFPQTDSTNYQKFYANFSGMYKMMAKPPLQNYYSILTDAAKFSFTPHDKLYRETLWDIARQYKIKEADALDTLANKVFRDIKNDLWFNFGDIYSKNARLFEIFNAAQCPCYTSRVSKTDMTEKLVTAIQECAKGLVTDTAFANNLKREGGDNSITDLFNLQRYTSLYLYANCEIINYKLTLSIKDNEIYSQYSGALSSFRMDAGRDAIRLFRENKFDSLKMIFPDYKKFTNEFNKVMNMLKRSAGIAVTNYEVSAEDLKPKMEIVYYTNKKDMLVGEVRLIASGNTLDAKFTSLRYVEYKPYRKPDFQVIEVVPK